MGILIKKFHTKNYKSILSETIVLNDLTVFFGQNNTGKTSILKALHLGLTYESINPEDVYDSIASPYTIQKEVIIDVYIQPLNGAEFDDDWGLVFGTGISVDQSDNQYCAFRTEITYDERRNAYRNSKMQIKNWQEKGESICGKTFNSRILDHIQSFYISEHRDIAQDLKDRRSLWSKLLAQVEIDPEKKREVQKSLEDVNMTIIEESELLKEIQLELEKSVSHEKFMVSISPVARDLQTLYKGIEIYYSSDSFNPVPVSNLGSGVRSWAVFSTIKSQLHYAKIKVIPFHALLLIEEPEAHVHPQAQMKLMETIDETVAQKIIATHSPYIINQIEFDKMTRVGKNEHGTYTSSNLALLSNEHINQIRREILATKADIVFANLIVLVEGITELFSLPIFFEYYFGVSPVQRGVSFFSVDGGKKYPPYLHLLHSLNIDYFIFSDGEETIKTGLNKALSDIYGTPNSNVMKFENIICLPNQENYEKHLIAEGFEPQIKRVIDALIETKHIKKDSWKDHKRAKERKFSTAIEEESAAILFYMSKNKTDMAPITAKEIVACCKSKSDLPRGVKRLFEAIERKVL